MRLNAAANTTAVVGRNTPVDTTVAIEFAASWNPFMNSNAMARATSITMTQRAVASIGSGMLEDAALDDVRDVLALVRDRLQQLVDRLELEHLSHVLLLAEQLADGRAHHEVRVGFELVDLLAGLERGLGHRGLAQALDHVHGFLDAVAALHRDVRQARDL